MIEEVIDVSDHAGFETHIPGGIGTEGISAPAKYLSFRKKRINIKIALGPTRFH